jgi:ABC-2 type transport system ATP-binding protein
LKQRIPGGHVQLQFADRAGLDAAASRLAVATRDDEALTLQVPSDGGVHSLRVLLNHLDESIEVEALSICTPDLDDVFFALTGQANLEGAVR